MDINYKKVGDALRYALFHELPDAKCMEHIHFKLVITYLKLFHYISEECRGKLNEYLVVLKNIKLYNKIRNDSRVFQRENKQAVEKIANMLAEELREQANMRGFSEVIETLNHKEFPDWLIESLDNIIGLFPNVAVIEEKEALYYIGGTISVSNFLLKISLSDIDDSRSVFNIINKKVVRLLSYVEGFLDIDRQTGHILMRAYDKNYFVDYDYRANDCRIVNMEFIEMMGHCPLGIHEGFLAYYLDGHIYHIKRYSKKEKYVVCEGDITVFPELRERAFFKPYKLTIDGNTRAYPDGNVREFLCCKIREFLFEYGDCARMPANVPDEITMDTVLKYLNTSYNSSDLCINEKYVILNAIFDTLEKYIQGSENIEDFLFVLCEAGLLLNEKDADTIDGPFTVSLLWQLRRFELQDNGNGLGVCLKHLTDSASLEYLKKKLLDGKKFCQSANIQPYVGYFTLKDTDESIKFEKVPLSEARSVGFMRCKDDRGGTFQYHDGMVMYYPINQTYFVQTHKSLTEKQKKKIQSEFNLSQERVQFWIQ